MIYDEEIEEKNSITNLTPRQTRTKQKSLSKNESESDIGEKMNDLIKMNEQLLKENTKLK